MKYFFISLLFSLIVLKAVSQDNEALFSLSNPGTKVHNSLYSCVQLIDLRHDTSNLGIVQKGFTKRIFEVQPDTLLSVQVQRITSAVIDDNTKHDSLLMLLRFFKFIELMDRSKQTGYCYVRAKMYSKKGNKYFPLHDIDTVVTVLKSSYSELTPVLFEQSSNAFTGFICSSLLLSSEGGLSYTLSELMNIDSLEKRSIPVYNNTVFTDGIYLTYQSFKNQTPDYEIKSVDTSDDEIAMLHANKPGGGIKRINSREVYAVIRNSTIYMPTEQGFGILKKRDDDFFIVGKAAVTYRNVVAHKVTGVIMLGLPGILSNPKASFKDFEMKLDHIDGLFIKLRELSRQEAKAMRKR